ncbi:MAG: type II toxin-antitoxin system VapC family toxin [Gammaproteobacteria bacterium]
MSYLLDTNIISEVMRKKPNVGVVAWLEAIPSTQLYLSVLTLGELRKGIERLKASKRKIDLVLWLEQELIDWFGENILPIDQAVAERWGYLSATSQQTLAAIDDLLAATALTNNLRMVTRNTKNFKCDGLEVIDPFQSVS